MITTRHNLLLLALLLCISLTARAQEEVLTDEDDIELTDSTLLTSDSTLLAPELSALPWEQSVRVQIDRLLEADMFRTSQVGMLVYDLTADSVIYAHGERQLMRPASTMKLVTAIAAIDRLGGSYQYKTDLCYTGTIADGTLQGQVYCVGGFDPRFNGDDMRAFVESLRKMGVDTIRGTIYADKSMKSADRYGEGWCWDDDFNPVLSPLLISKKDLFTERFVSELREAGITVDAFTSTGTKPDDAFCITRRFHTIDQILMPMLKQSDNLYAEATFYQIAANAAGRGATAKDAANAIGRLIAKVGLDPKRYVIADGSGLSLYNYLTPELEVRLLRYAYHNSNIYLHLHPALPEAGVDGTLRKRMRGAFTRSNVFAKTGTVRGVSCLAGYCTAANGHQLAFSIMNNGLLHISNGRQFQDRVCTILCQP